MAKVLVDRYFVLTRKMIRAALRKEHGRNGFDSAWARYQENHRGKPQVQTFTRRERVKRKGQLANGRKS